LSVMICDSAAADKAGQNRNETGQTERRSSSRGTDLTRKVHQQIKELESRVTDLENKLSRLAPPDRQPSDVDRKLQQLKSRIDHVREQIQKLSDASGNGTQTKPQRKASAQAAPLDRETTVILDTRPSATSSAAPADPSDATGQKAVQTTSQAQQTIRRWYRIPTGYVPLLPSVPVSSTVPQGQTQIIRGAQTAFGTAGLMRVYSTTATPQLVSLPAPQQVSLPAPQQVSLSAPQQVSLSAPQQVTYVPQLNYAPQLVSGPAPQFVTAPVTQVAVPTVLRFRYTQPVIYRYRY
ncbi:MAG: hypothetical protein VB858_13550, partial [Planctomycetaceae bacterium]